jgi:hypothetical protein
MESGELDSAILSYLPTSDRMSLLRRQRNERFMVLRLAISYDGRDVPMGEYAMYAVLIVADPAKPLISRTAFYGILE